MRLLEYTQVSLETIGANTLRSALTALGVAIGSAAQSSSSPSHPVRAGR